ncbi:MAG: hypothetical protein RLZZ458_2161 [Planctomycetota bacterium]|jgi:hypothetical protein
MFFGKFQCEIVEEIVGKEIETESLKENEHGPPLQPEFATREPGARVVPAGERHRWLMPAKNTAVQDRGFAGPVRHLRTSR